MYVKAKTAMLLTQAIGTITHRAKRRNGITLDSISKTLSTTDINDPIRKAMWDTEKPNYATLITKSPIIFPVLPNALSINFGYEKMPSCRPDSTSIVAADAEITPEMIIKRLEAI